LKQAAFGLSGREHQWTSEIALRVLPNSSAQGVGECEPAVARDPDAIGGVARQHGGRHRPVELDLLADRAVQRVEHVEVEGLGLDEEGVVVEHQEVVTACGPSLGQGTWSTSAGRRRPGRRYLGLGIDRCPGDQVARFDELWGRSFLPTSSGGEQSDPGGR